MAIESLNVTATGLPSGVTVNGSTGELSGSVPTGTACFESNAQAAYNVSVTVTTGNRGTASKDISIIVKKTKYEIRSSAGVALANIPLADLQSMIADGTALSQYGIGAELIVPVHNLFGDTAGMIRECPFRFGTFRQFELQNGTTFNGLGLESKYALPVTAVPFDAAEPSNSDSNRKSYGNNRWMYSALRQWMNKTGTDWWASQHSADAAPTTEGWTSAVGLLDCFPSTFVDALRPVKVTTKTHSVDGGENDVTYDKFFLLSQNEYGYSDSTNVPDEGAVWEIYDGVSNSDRIHYAIGDHSEAQYDWLRSVRPNSSSIVRRVNPDGSLNSYRAYYQLCVCAACVLMGASA